MGEPLITYFIVGLDRESGDERSLVVQDKTEQGAQEQAFSRGMMIEYVEELPKPTVKSRGVKIRGYVPARVESDARRAARFTICGLASPRFHLVFRRIFPKDRNPNSDAFIVLGLLLVLLVFLGIFPYVALYILGVIRFWLETLGLR